MTKIVNEAASIDAPVLPSPPPVQILTNPAAVASAHPALTPVPFGSPSHPALQDRAVDVASVADLSEMAAALTPAPR